MLFMSFNYYTYVDDNMHNAEENCAVTVDILIFIKFHVEWKRMNS